MYCYIKQKFSYFTAVYWESLFSICSEMDVNKELDEADQ